MMVKNPAGARTMNPGRRQPQYLDLLLLMHRDAFAAGSDQSGRRTWWYIVRLMLPVAFFFSLIIFVSSPKALAVDVDQLEDLTGGGGPGVAVEGDGTVTQENGYFLGGLQPTGESL